MEAPGDPHNSGGHTTRDGQATLMIAVGVFGGMAFGAVVAAAYVTAQLIAFGNAHQNYYDPVSGVLFDVAVAVFALIVGVLFGVAYGLVCSFAAVAGRVLAMKLSESRYVELGLVVLGAFVGAAVGLAYRPPPLDSWSPGVFIGVVGGIAAAALCPAVIAGNLQYKSPRAWPRSK